LSVDREVRLEQGRKKSKTYRIRQKERGLCRSCPLPIYRDNRCYYHYLKQLQIDKQKKQRRFDNNRCTGCGQPLIEEEKGRAVCFNCGIHTYPIKINETYT
jgi:hypothetical protein